MSEPTKYAQQFNDYGIVESAQGDYVKFQDYAKLREQLATAESDTTRAKHVAHATASELIASEAKLKALDEQDPLTKACKNCGGTWDEESLRKNGYKSCFPEREMVDVFTRPIPPADVAELQQKCASLADGAVRQAMRIAELERKLAEQQAMFHVNMLRAWPEKSHDEISEVITSKGGAEELNKLRTEQNTPAGAHYFLTDELAAMKHDAERFRWLLENCTDFMCPVNGALTNGRFKYKRGSCFSPREAIDKAMADNAEVRGCANTERSNGELKDG